MTKHRKHLNTRWWLNLYFASTPVLVELKMILQMQHQRIKWALIWKVQIWWVWLKQPLHYFLFCFNDPCYSVSKCMLLVWLQWILYVESLLRNGSSNGYIFMILSHWGHVWCSFHIICVVIANNKPHIFVADCIIRCLTGMVSENRFWVTIHHVITVSPFEGAKIIVKNWFNDKIW